MIGRNKIEYLSEKTEFICVDYFKLLCAMLVVTIHIPMFKDINSELAFWTDQILARLAVPFFFMSSGYFIANKINDFSKFTSYCKRILMLYAIYTLLYLQPIIYDLNRVFVNIRASIIEVIKRLFIIGSYIQLWYFIALFTSVVILYLAVNKLKLSARTLLFISTVFYIIGVLGNGYQNLFLDTPILGTIMKLYYSLFKTTRNGLFFGFLYVTIGYLVHQQQNSVKNKFHLYITATILSFFAMNLEEYFARYITNHHKPDMIFLTPIVTTFLFLTICFIKVSPKYHNLGATIRKISVLIFGFHLFIYFYLNLLFTKYGLYVNSITVYFITVILNTLLAILLIKLDKVRIFHWVRYLY